MGIQLPEIETEYLNALIDAAELGAQRAFAKAGHLKPYLKLYEAYRIYGEGTVDRWVEGGPVDEIKDGDRNSSVRIDRIQVKAVAKTYNRASYLSRD